MFVKLFLLLLVTATLAKELTFKHYIFEESCYSLFFEKNDFFNVPCLKLVNNLPDLDPLEGVGLRTGLGRLCRQAPPDRQNSE